VDLDVKPGLEDVFVLDAGGFSLDFFASIEGQSFGRSYAAGGEALTAAARHYLAKSGGNLRGTNLEEHAEIRKREACSSLDGSKFGKEMEDCTKKIYAPALTDIAKWLRAHAGGRALPLIISGGAAENRFLQRQVHDTLESAGVPPVPTDAVELAQLIGANRLGKNAYLRRFRSITFRYDESAEPSSYLDVIGGLIEEAVE
jgi:hydrogenase maturation factor HypF (carbamoyltransferase family)